MVFEGLGGLSWWSWGACWLQVGGLGVTWSYLGLKLEVLGPSWLQVGRSWSHLGGHGEKPTISLPLGRAQNSDYRAAGWYRMIFGLGGRTIGGGKLST